MLKDKMQLQILAKYKDDSSKERFVVERGYIAGIVYEIERHGKTYCVYVKQSGSQRWAVLAEHKRKLESARKAVIEYAMQFVA